MHCLDGVNLSVSIRQESHIEPLLVDAHAKDTIFSQVNVLVVEHLLFRIRTDGHTALVDEVRQQSTHQHTSNTQLRFLYFAVCQLLIDRFEVGFQQNIVLFIVVFDYGLHVVGGEGSRKHMDEAKRSFEGFVHQMSEVILHLLGSLNICEF